MNDEIDEDTLAKARNILALSELGYILRSLREVEIPCIVLKGASLLEALYHDDFSRPMSDLDILVHREQLPTVERQLSKLGYFFLSHNWGNHVTYRKKEPASIPVEIHCELFNMNNPLQRHAFNLVTEDIWNNAVSAQIAGEESLVLSPEDLIIYLSCHMLKESYSEAKWIEDLDRIVRHHGSTLDWDKVVTRGRQYGVGRPICYALSILHRQYGTPFPRTLLEELAPHRSGLLVNAVTKRLRGNRPLHKWWLLPLYLSVMGSASDRIRATVKLCPYLLARSFVYRNQRARQQPLLASNNSHKKCFNSGQDSHPGTAAWRWPSSNSLRAFTEPDKTGRNTTCNPASN